MDNLGRVIDVHGHVGTLERFRPGYMPPWMWADGRSVSELVTRAGIDCAFVSSTWSCFGERREGDAVAAAESFSNLKFWAVLDPRDESAWKDAARFLNHPRCVGLKIHPVLQGWSVREHLMDITAFASTYGATILSHSETGNPLVDPLVFLSAANAFPDVNLIMAHAGWGLPHRVGQTFDQFLAVEAAKACNLYVDTASQALIFNRFLEEAVRRFGSRQILFGTDLPVHDPFAILAHVSAAAIADEDRRAILHMNARRIWPSLGAGAE